MTLKKNYDGVIPDSFFIGLTNPVELKNNGGVFEVPHAVIFNPDGEDLDFKINGSSVDNLFCLNAGDDKIGIGTATPMTKFEIRGASYNYDYNYPFQSSIIDTETEYNATSPFPPGGGIAFGGIYKSDGTIVNFFAGIQGCKENTTNDNFASQLLFLTRESAGYPVKNASLSSTGIFWAKGYQSSDGSAGISTTFADNNGNTITVKNGLITAKT